MGIVAMPLENDEQYLITPEPQEELIFSAFMENLSASLSTGIKLVQLRTKKMSEERYRELAQAALAVCCEHRAQLILNGPIHDLGRVDADGVHLDSDRLRNSRLRPFGAHKLVSASCHSLEELLHAEKIGVDFVTLSPVLATKSHPDATPIGWERFSDLVKSVRIPVYALGGMDRSNISLAKSYGAYGIAGIRGLWSSDVAS